jgi:hypothetical protein
MNSKSVKKTYIVLAFVALVLLGGVRAQCQIMSVSVPTLHVANNERIISFEIHVHSGRIALLPNVPIGWNITVNNDPSWDTAITGVAVVGAAMMYSDFLQDILVVEVEKDAPSDSRFSLDGEVSVTSDGGATERRIKLSMRDFVTKGTEGNKIAKGH